MYSNPRVVIRENAPIDTEIQYNQSISNSHKCIKQCLNKYVFGLCVFCLKGRFPSLPQDFKVYTVTLSVFHCQRCQIRTLDHGLK